MRGDVNLKNLTLSIRESKLTGRPRTKSHPMIGFAATVDEADTPLAMNVDYMNPNDLVGARVRFLFGDSREYNGIVREPRLKPSGIDSRGRTQPEIQVWRVDYPHGQYGGDDDDSDDDEVEIVALKEGRARYRTWENEYQRGYRLYT